MWNLGNCTVFGACLIIKQKVQHTKFWLKGKHYYNTVYIVTCIPPLVPVLSDNV